MVFNFGYFVGYSETQCINSTLQLFKVLMAKEISFNELIPVDRITENFFLLISFSKGILFISPEGILIILIFNFFNIFKLLN